MQASSSPILGIRIWSINDGAYYCYCAYVLRISRYLGFLSVMLTNTGIFLSGLKPSGESRSYHVLLVSKRKLGVTMHFLKIIKVQFEKERRTFRRARTSTHALAECLNKREKRSTSRRGAGASYQTSHPGISARAIAFGRSWPFAAFCYRPRLPVRHRGSDMSAPNYKPYETNPPPTHSSRPPLSI